MKIMYNGFKFVLVSNGYYKGRVNGISKWLHRYVWECNYGEIPDGYHIHHKDGNKSNNVIENLECVPGSVHLSLHMCSRPYEQQREAIKVAQEAAKEWHKSDVGRKWHSEKMKQQQVNRKYVDKICEVCGTHYNVDEFSAWKSKYCSNKCRAQARRDSHIDDELRVCVVCGKDFYTNRYSKVKTCSRSCAYKSRFLS